VQLKIRANTFSSILALAAFSVGLPDPAISGRAGESEFSVVVGNDVDTSLRPATEIALLMTFVGVVSFKLPRVVGVLRLS
jgi:hypothetical protein